jgi:hypothetical protein
MAAVTRLDRLRPAPVILVLLSLSLAGCVAPLGPGFQLRREVVTVRYALPPAAPALHFSVQAVARNTGNRALTLLRIQAPSRAPTAMSSPTSASTAGSDLRSSLPVRLQPPLARGQARRIPFAYLVPVRGDAIFLEPQGWFPSFLPPRGPFATSQPWAPKTEIDIYAPPEDRVLTTGRLRRVHAAPPGRDAEYVYEIGERDFPPFLLIGKYREQRVRAGGQSVLLWTRGEPFDSSCVRAVASEAVATARLYRSVFGRLREHLGPLRLVEFPSQGLAPGSNTNPGTGTLPNGALFTENPADACRQRNAFYFQLARDLAATWFGWAVRPAPGASAILSGVQDYAALMAEETQESPSVRRQQVALWLSEYDRLSSETQPLPPAELGSHPAGDQFRMAGVQSALFFVALEDRLGAEPVRRALQDLVRSLDGSTAGPDELRSALEGESGQNLYDFFNQWLGRAGIPAAFRRRFSGQELKSDRGENAVKQSGREAE